MWSPLMDSRFTSKRAVGDNVYVEVLDGARRW